MFDLNLFKESVKNNAENYVENFGWAVLPCYSVAENGSCTCRKPTCDSVGKHPFGHDAPNGAKDGTKDIEQVHAWFAPSQPMKNLAVATGKISGITVIDVDGDVGKESIKKISEKVGFDFENTLHWQTGSGGRHYFFQYVEKIKGGANGSFAKPEFKELFEKIDVRNDGGYIVAPPSRHKSGGSYLIDMAGFWADKILEMPPALLDLFADKTDSAQKETPKVDAETAEKRQKILENLKNKKGESAQKTPQKTKENKAVELPDEVSFDAAKELFLRSMKERENSIPYKTGIDSVDSLLSEKGGWQPKSLYVLGARTGLGKTAFALQCAVAAAKQGIHAVYFTLENPADEIQARNISRWTHEKMLNGGKGFSADFVLSGKMWAETLQNFWLESESWKRFLTLIPSTPEGLSAESVRRVLERFYKKHNPQMPPFVVVDYLQLLDSEKRERAGEFERANSVLMVLRQITIEFGVPMLALSSLNRAAYYSTISEDSFKDTSNIEMSANCLLGIQYKGMSAIAKLTQDSKKREEFKKASDAFTAEAENTPSGSTLDFLVIKNRNWKKGETAIKYAPRCHRFTDAPHCYADENIGGAGATPDSYD